VTGTARILVLAGLLTGCHAKVAEPDDAVAARGAELFESRACATCHRPGGRGGMLEGVASSRTRDWFAAYLKNPVAEHPQSMMPTYDLEAAEVQALWAYLEWRDMKAE